MAFGVKAVIDKAANQGGVHDGDVWIFNDPYDGGTHLSDFRLVKPVFRDGDLIIVSPQAGVRRGDRVVVKTTEGEVMAKSLARRTARNVDLVSFNDQYEDRTIPLEQVLWIARIVWASQ